jgi:hypothetical protein
LLASRNPLSRRDESGVGIGLVGGQRQRAQRRQGDGHGLTQRWIADPDFGATLVVGLDPHGLRAARFAPQMGDHRRFVVKHRLATEIRVFLGFAGWDVDPRDGRPAIRQNELELVAIEVIAGRNDPPSL